ncbi:MAG TPA: hypothetical protein VKB46_15010 [Pyrinomonadaceae bacterium]|nr:hypothetical protein [Pyrinomonadaceae bacterium]
MASSERQAQSTKWSRSTLVIVVAVVAAIVMALFFYLLMRAGGKGTPREPTLQGAIRAGSPEFEQWKPKIVLDDQQADEAKRALGDIVMSLRTTVRNITGRTLDGLEIRAAVVDHQGKPVRERTVVIIPTRQAELEPNKTMAAQVMLEGMTETDDRANILMEVTGFRFKQ